MENKWEGNRVLLGEGKLQCTLTKEPWNYISHLCDMGFPSSKLNNSNLINLNLCYWQSISLSPFIGMVCFVGECKVVSYQAAIGDM